MHATPLHATPRHATPRHATPRHAKVKAKANSFRTIMNVADGAMHQSIRAIIRPTIIRPWLHAYLTCHIFNESSLKTNTAAFMHCIVFCFCFIFFLSRSVMRRRGAQLKKQKQLAAALGSWVAVSRPSFQRPNIQRLSLSLSLSLSRKHSRVSLFLLADDLGVRDRHTRTRLSCCCFVPFILLHF